jgi:hypothetical protein
VFDYLGAAKPVLAITPPDSATARFVRQAGGWVVSPGDAIAFAETFLQILDEYRNNTLGSHSPSPEFIRDHAISARAKMIMELLESITGKTVEGGKDKA